MTSVLRVRRLYSNCPDKKYGITPPEDISTWKQNSYWIVSVFFPMIDGWFLTLCWQKRGWNALRGRTENVQQEYYFHFLKYLQFSLGSAVRNRRSPHTPRVLASRYPPFESDKDVKFHLRTYIRYFLFIIYMNSTNISLSSLHTSSDRDHQPPLYHCIFLVL